MKRWLVWTGVFVVCVTQAHADETSKRAKLEELFQITHLQRIMDDRSASMLREAESMRRGLPAPEHMKERQRHVVRDFHERLAKLVVDALSWNAIKDSMVDIYADTYTEADIDNVLAFYKSPSGQAWADKSPELSQRRTQVIQGRVDALQPKLKEMVAEFGRQFAAAGK